MIIDTTSGTMKPNVIDSRNLGSATKPSRTGRSYQLDSRPIPREEVKLSSATELAYQTRAAIGGDDPNDSKPGAQQTNQVAEDPNKRVPVKTVFNLDAVDNNLMFLHDKPMPHKILTDMNEIEMKCQLCLDLPCCPEHCCDVSKILSLNVWESLSDFGSSF